MLIANEFINALPIDETPQETKGYEGFIMHHLSGSIEETVLELIIETTTRLNSKNAKRK
jgi:tripeptide aminopeptidase